MVMRFELPNVANHFFLQNLRVFSNKGDLMRTLEAMWDPHVTWWGPHEKIMEESLLHQERSLFVV